ncbi:hypothetical protein BDB01DRAFT_850503 [Pilobolus umbonatus]|nr:hypothetical protein BDB01DRAFT_850503 [Pilobolus umbonatus]
MYYSKLIIITLAVYLLDNVMASTLPDRRVQLIDEIAPIEKRQAGIVALVETVPSEFTGIVTGGGTGFIGGDGGSGNTGYSSSRPNSQETSFGGASLYGLVKRQGSTSQGFPETMETMNLDILVFNDVDETP